MNGHRFVRQLNKEIESATSAAVVTTIGTPPQPGQGSLARTVVAELEAATTALRHIGEVSSTGATIFRAVSAAAAGGDEEKRVLAAAISDLRRALLSVEAEEEEVVSEARAVQTWRGELPSTPPTGRAPRLAESSPPTLSPRDHHATVLMSSESDSEGEDGLMSASSRAKGRSQIRPQDSGGGGTDQDLATFATQYDSPTSPSRAKAAAGRDMLPVGT